MTLGGGGEEDLAGGDARANSSSRPQTRASGRSKAGSSLKDSVEGGGSQGVTLPEGGVQRGPSLQVLNLLALLVQKCTY